MEETEIYECIEGFLCGLEHGLLDMPDDDDEWDDGDCDDGDCDDGDNDDGDNDDDDDYCDGYDRDGYPLYRDGCYCDFLF